MIICTSLFIYLFYVVLKVIHVCLGYLLKFQLMTI